MTWQDFKGKQSKQPNERAKGDEFEKLVQLYLTHSPAYSNILNKIWLLDEVPQKTKKYLKLPDRDMGIDLICETTSKEYWAIQCKYLTDEDSSLGHKMLSTFTSLATGYCKNIDQLLVCTSANRYGSFFNEYPNISFITGETWRELDENYFDILYKNKDSLGLIPYSPFEYQQPAVDKSKIYFSKYARGKLIMPCGSGKSLTAYWIADRLEAKRIIVALPSIYLIKQTVEVWFREIVANKQDYSYRIVCSDVTTGMIDKSSELKTNIQDIGIPADTNIESISNWLVAHKEKSFIVFTTYQSGKTLAEATSIAKVEFDFAIFDEAHKTVGKKDKPFSYLLHKENIAIDKMMFMTATERFYKGNSNEINSMDDSETYGEIIHQLKFREAIDISKNMERPILCDYQLHTINVKRSEINKMIKENIYVKPNKGGWDEEIKIRFILSLLTLRRAIKDLNVKHTISFHGSLAKAKAFNESQELINNYFNDKDLLESFFIDGKYSSSKRKSILDDFIRKESALLTNARCLTEGIDIPMVDCILFADPKQSKVDIVQALGRALRDYKGKEIGYVLLPIIIEDEDDSRDEKQYQEVLKVIRQLASNDSRIIEYFKTKSKGESSRVGGVVNVDSSFIEIDLDEFEKDFHLRGYKSLDGLSWMPYNDAKAYVHLLGLKNQKEWQKFAASDGCPQDIPSDPQRHYDEFESYGEWLGTGRISNKTKSEQFVDYETAKDFAKSLRLNGYVGWDLYINGKFKNKPKIPDSIPKYPNDIYTEFEGWVEFTGSGRYDAKYGYSYSKAKKIIHPLKFKSEPQFSEWKDGKRPDLIPFDLKIPKKPDWTYVQNGGWVSWPDFLGYDPDNPKGYWDYNQAKEYISKALLKGYKEFYKWRDGELVKEVVYVSTIPPYPINYYRAKNRGWNGWDDFLSVPINKPGIRNGEEVSFDDCREYIMEFGLKNQKDYNKWAKTKRPKWFPSNPDKFFTDDYKGLNHFIGVYTYKLYDSQLLPYEKVVEFVLDSGVRNGAEWLKYFDSNPVPFGIPKKIPSRYPNEFTSWPELLEDKYQRTIKNNDS